MSIDKEAIKEACRAAAFDLGQPCPTCGDGKIPGGRMVIHSQLGMFGADWDLEGVLQAVEEAAEIQWHQTFTSNDLQVLQPSGKWICFAVPAPKEAAS